MTDRRYSRDEADAIFARAAQAEERATGPGAPSEGMSLAELQEIGREVGLSPAVVARAALALDQAGRPTSRRILGFPIQVGLNVSLGRVLTDDEWERLVVDLRTTFDARGVVRQDGNLRQWTNGNLQVLVEPGEGGHRVRMRTTNGLSRNMAASGVAILAAGAAMALSAVMGGGAPDAGGLVGTALIAVLGTGMLGGAALRLPGWAAQRRRQMEAIAARLVQAIGSAPGNSKL